MENNSTRQSCFHLFVCNHKWKKNRIYFCLLYYVDSFLFWTWFDLSPSATQKNSATCVVHLLIAHSTLEEWCEFSHPKLFWIPLPISEKWSSTYWRHSPGGEVSSCIMIGWRAAGETILKCKILLSRHRLYESKYKNTSGNLKFEES